MPSQVAVPEDTPSVGEPLNTPTDEGGIIYNEGPIKTEQFKKVKNRNEPSVNGLNAPPTNGCTGHSMNGGTMKGGGGGGDHDTSGDSGDSVNGQLHLGGVKLMSVKGELNGVGLKSTKSQLNGVGLKSVNGQLNGVGLKSTKSQLEGGVELKSVNGQLNGVGLKSTVNGEQASDKHMDEHLTAQQKCGNGTVAAANVDQSPTPCNLIQATTKPTYVLENGAIYRKDAVGEVETGVSLIVNGSFSGNDTTIASSPSSPPPRGSEEEEAVVVMRFRSLREVPPLSEDKGAPPQADISMESPNTSSTTTQARPAGPNEVIPAESLWTTKCDQPVRLRMSEQGPGSMRPVSVMTAFQDIVGRYPEQLAMAVKISGLWRSWTYRTYYADVWCAARALIRLGLEPYHGVGIIGFNSPEWFISNLATIFAGGLSTGIYSTNSSEACRYVACNARCQVIVVENNYQLQKILAVRAALPHLKAIVQYSGELNDPADPHVYTWSDFMRLGEEDTETYDVLLQQRISQQSVNKCCVLIYTSGTTGNPKGVMLSHDNITFMAKVAGLTIRVSTGCESVVSYLPLSHIAGQMLDIYIPLLYAASVYFAQPDAMKGTLTDTLREVEPTAFLGVPRVWEKMQEKLAATFTKKSWMKRSLLNWAQGVGLRGNLARMNGRRFPFGWSVASSMVFSKIHQLLGLSRCKIFLTAAAPITKDTLEFFSGLNMPIMELYGMSETSGPHTGNEPHHWRMTSVGPVISGMSVSIIGAGPDGDGGEICMAGRNVFMGYLDEEEKTRETIDADGYLHSGDIGKFDADGFLYITGRIKELIITAGGENVAPVSIEDAVKEALPCVSNCMVVGDRRKFLSILLTLKTNIDSETGEHLDTLTDSTVAWCKAQGSKACTVTDVLERAADPVMHAIQAGINAANAKSASRAQFIQKFCILPRDFSLAGGELGPTVKLKRPYVVQVYQTAIENFYSEDE